MLREIHGETKTAFYVRGLRRLLNLRSLVVKKNDFSAFFYATLSSSNKLNL